MNLGKNIPEWDRFSVGQPSDSAKWTNPDCCLLDSISHVSHIEHGWSIIESGGIQAGLISDKSKLNRERILVAWLSPNIWQPGSRYGNVRFRFDWKELIENRQAYWVESIAYGVDACRILLTDVDHTPLVTPYDPTIGDGPWWHDKDNDKHYWNSEYCLEIMIEGDIQLSQATGIFFEKHHEEYCCISPGNCIDQGVRPHVGGASFLAGLVGRSIRLPRRLLTNPELDDRPYSDAQDAAQQLHHLLRECGKGASGGKLSQDASSAIARAIFFSLSRRNLEEAASLSKLFPSQAVMLEECKNLFYAHFGWDMEQRMV